MALKPTMLGVKWEQIEALYFVRKNCKVPIEYYLGKFKNIEFFFSNKDFTSDNVDLFFVWLCNDFKRKNGREMSTSYYNKYLALLRAIAKKLNSDALSQFESKHNVYKETERLTVEECERLLSVDFDYVRDSDYINYKWKLIIKVLLITTCRPGELSRATWENFINNTIYIEATKNRTTHEVILPSNVADEVRQLKKYPHGFIFGELRGKYDLKTLNAEIKKRCVKAGILKAITAKSLRPTGITSYLKKYPIHKVAKISNHRNINVLFNHYYKPEKDEIQAIVDDNDFQPKEPTVQDVIDEFRKVIDKFRNTKFKDKIMALDSLINKKLSIS